MLKKMRDDAKDNFEKERTRPFSTFDQMTGEQAQYIDWLREQGKDPQQVMKGDKDAYAQSRVDFKLSHDKDYVEGMRKARAYVQDKLKADPRYLQSTGWIEDFIRMGPQIGAQVVAGVLTGGAGSAALMFAQITGGTVEELVEKGVPFERAVQAGMINAAIQAPLEAFGMTKALGAVKLRNKAFAKLRAAVDKMGTEWITEYVQEYPDAAAKLWAENPDMDFMQKFNKFVDTVTDPEFQKGAARNATIASVWGGVAGTPSIATAQADPKKDDPNVAASEVTHQSREVEKVDDGMYIVKDR
jgi:hypothetical protein